MTVDEALVSWLLSKTAVANLVADRVSPNLIGEAETRPSIAYQKLGREPVRSLAGFDTLQPTRYQLTCCAKTFKLASDLATAVEKSTGAGTGPVKWVWAQVAGDQYDPSTVTAIKGLPRTLVDVELWTEGL